MACCFAASQASSLIQTPVNEASAVRQSLFLAKLLIRSRIARLLPKVRRLTDGGARFLHYYSDRILMSPQADLRKAADLLLARAPDVLDLASGSPTFDIVPSASTKLPADRRDWSGPWGLAELRQAIADKLKSEPIPRINPADEVLITHGASGAFSTVLETFINPGDRVVLFDPTSPLFDLFLRYRRARVSWLPTWMEDGYTRFRDQTLAKLIRRARMIVLATPNNPTGGLVSAEDLDRITWWAERRDVLIVNDTTFDSYMYEARPPSIGTLPRARERTITIGSVSKTYALASMRVGWLAGHRHLVRPGSVAASLQTPFVPVLSQQVALTALRECGGSLETIHKEFESRRLYTFERLQAMGLKPAWPSGAFFYWVPVKELGLSGQEFTDRFLFAKKALIWPGAPFGPSGGDFVRLSYAAEDGRLREGLTRLADFVRELREKRPTHVNQAA
jgi:aspartate/methionine/tyrosine aminotransferase